jgi:hypothetical protein
MLSNSATFEQPCAYEVVGEHEYDPTRLLVLAEDGQFYALSLRDGHIEATNFDDSWVIDTCDPYAKIQRAKLNFY